jgi:transcriptional regulator with XRE-family HTH domain
MSNIKALKLANEIEQIRLLKNLTKTQMAKKLKVSSSYYSDFIKGNKPISSDKIAAWAYLLDIDEQRLVELSLEAYLERYDFPYYTVTLTYMGEENE